MESLHALTLIGVIMFAATNIDDLLLLSMWFANRAISTRSVVLGQYAGIATLFAVSAIAAAAAAAVPPSLLSWLGLVPIAIAARQLIGSSDPDIEGSPPTGYAGIAAITIANGGDNLGVYIPTFATSSTVALVVWGGVFVVMTALWCWAAAALVRHPRWREPLGRLAARIVPWVLIALGISILLR